jgi:signal transduction histidine kinase
VYLHLHNYKQASRYLLKALKMAEAINDARSLFSIHELLSEVYAKTYRYDKAYEHYEEYIKIKNSLQNTEMAKNIDQLEVKYRTAQKDIEITRQRLLLSQKENKLKEKNNWIWGITVCMAISLFIVFVLFYNYRRRQRMQNITMQNMRHEQKIGQLTAMIQGEEKERTRIARELHDGIGGLLSAAKMNFYTFHHIYDMIPGFHQGIKLLDEAYDDLRKTAHNLLPETLLQEGLVNAVMVYCSKIDKQILDLSFQSFGNLPRLVPENELSLYRIIQELIHNILKHAHATKAVVQIDLHDEYLQITIEDNGIGIREKINRSGIGMKNLRSRVSAMGGHMEIDSRESIGTSVYIEFNIYKLQNAEIICA